MAIKMGPRFSWNFFQPQLKALLMSKG